MDYNIINHSPSKGYKLKDLILSENRSVHKHNIISRFSEEIKECRRPTNLEYMEAFSKSNKIFHLGSVN